MYNFIFDAFACAGIILHAVDIGYKVYGMVAMKQASIHKFGDITKVEVPSSVDSRPGGYYFLRIPAISALEWHPFSISCTEGRNVCFYIKV